MKNSIFGMCVCTLSHVRLFAAPWTVACQVPLSTGFPKKEYWTRLPFPPAGDFPGPKDQTCVSCIVGGFFTTGPSGNFFLIYSFIYLFKN